jgi:hypothetical protein
MLGEPHSPTANLVGAFSSRTFAAKWLDDAVGARSPRGQCRLVCTSTNLSKSALINTMLYRQVLPVGAVPVTAVTTVTFGTPERVLVVDYLGGASRDEPLAGLARVARPAAGRLSSWRQRRVD